MKTSLFRILLTSMLLTVTVATVLVGCLWVMQEMLRFRSEAASIHDRLISERKQYLKKRVDEAVLYLSFMQSQTEEQTRTITRERVYEVHRLATHLHEWYRDKISDGDLQALIRETLRTMKFSDGRGYLFATRLDGVVQLCTTCDEFENVNALGRRDAHGSLVTRDMVSLVSREGEGYYRYYWSHPYSSEEQPVLSFIKLFEPFNWLIGVGVYQKDVEKDLQTEALKWIQKNRSETGEYLFAGRWDGTSLSGPMVGQDRYEATDENGVKIVQEMIAQAKSGDGFISHVIPSLAGTPSVPKISYVKGLDDWQWYIGTGTSVDDIDSAVAEHKRQAVGKLVFTMGMIGIALLLLWCVVLGLTTVINRKTRATLATFTDSFSRAMQSRNGLREDELIIEEFRNLIEAANQVVNEWWQSEESLRQAHEEVERYFSLSLDLLCIATTEGKFVRLNPQWKNVLGYDPEMLQGRRYLDFVHPDDLATTVSAMTELEEQHEILNYENRYQCIDGSYRWIEWRSRPFGKTIYAAARDITERKRAEEQLRTSHELLSAFIKHSPIYAFIKEVTDSDSRTLWASENYREMIGIPGSQMAGKTMAELFPAEFAAKIVADDLQAIKSEQILHLDEELQGRRYTTIKFPINLGETRYLAGYTIDVTEHLLAEEALRRSEETFRNIVQASPMGIHLYEIQSDNRLVFIGGNEAADRLLSTDHQALIGKSIEDAFPSLAGSDIPPRYRRAALYGENWHSEHVDYEDKQIKGAFEVFVFQMSPGRVAVLFNEITERRRAEQERERLQAELTLAQKMESVGRLAGGVAHDFNNMLGVIIGHTDLAMRNLQIDEPLMEQLRHIRSAAERSADLTRQLLAFARKQPITPKILELNDTIAGIMDLLRRLSGEAVELEWRPAQHACVVKVDPSQIDQILVNLCVNARDAIADTGMIRIETQRTVITEAWCEGHPGLSPGEYVLLKVSDNGCGIAPEDMEHLFEPFFTTKKTGQGTGLGLATVYGIVKQNNGYIDVASELGRGTSFTIYLPAQEESPTVSGNEREPQMEAPPPGTILVVEDEPMILEITSQMLHFLGYSVLTAATPDEALDKADSYGETINLLMTDVVMPDMNGQDLAMQIVMNSPNLKTLFMSGYTADVITLNGLLEEGVNFIQKPFSLEELDTVLRKLLRSPRDSGRNDA